MAKKVASYIKLQVPAGKANPSPPVGPALGQHGVNIMEFCKAFNAETTSVEPGLPIPVIITVYSDRSFTFITKTPPAAVLLCKAAGVKHLVLFHHLPDATDDALDALEEKWASAKEPTVSLAREGETLSVREVEALGAEG